MSEISINEGTYSFNSATGFPEDEASRRFALGEARGAIITAQDKLLNLIGGRTNKCAVVIRGIGGSYAFGKPRVGLFPKGVSYEQADHIEHGKSHVSGGGVSILDWF